MTETNCIGLAHTSILIADTQRALDFYCGVLGLAIQPGRPDLGYPGAWLQLGDQQLHLLELPNPDPITGRPAHVGRDRHICIQVESLAALCERLDRAGVAYTLSRSGRRALFCRDPDSNGLEFAEN